jgi:hypothetical protein
MRGLWLLYPAVFEVAMTAQPIPLGLGTPHCAVLCEQAGHLGKAGLPSYASCMLTRSWWRSTSEGATFKLGVSVCTHQQRLLQPAAPEPKTSTRLGCHGCCCYQYLSHHIQRHLNPKLTPTPFMAIPMYPITFPLLVVPFGYWRAM